MSEHRMLRWFKLDHLPMELRLVAQPFCDAAQLFAKSVPPGPEATAALRKLVEAKDCAVRAYLEGKSDTAVTLAQTEGQPDRGKY